MKLTKLLLLLSSSFLLAGCTLGQKVASNANNESGNSSQNSESTSEEQLGEEKTYTITTNDDTWKSEFSGGTGFVDSGTTNNSANRERLVSYVGGSDNIATAVTCTGAIDSLNYGHLSSDQKTNIDVGLAIGGGSKIGTLKIDFAKTIKSISVYAIRYYKYYKTYTGDPYNGQSIDSNSVLLLSGGSQTSTLDLTETELESVHNIEYSVSNKSFTLANQSDDHGRVIIDKIEITYYE